MYPCQIGEPVAHPTNLTGSKSYQNLAESYKAGLICSNCGLMAVFLFLCLFRCLLFHCFRHAVHTQWHSSVHYRRIESPYPAASGTPPPSESYDTQALFNMSFSECPIGKYLSSIFCYSVRLIYSSLVMPSWIASDTLKKYKDLLYYKLWRTWDVHIQLTWHGENSTDGPSCERLSQRMEYVLANLLTVTQRRPKCLRDTNHPLVQTR